MRLKTNQSTVVSAGAVVLMLYFTLPYLAPSQSWFRDVVYNRSGVQWILLCLLVLALMLLFKRAVACRKSQCLEISLGQSKAMDSKSLASAAMSTPGLGKRARVQRLMLAPLGNDKAAQHAQRMAALAWPRDTTDADPAALAENLTAAEHAEAALVAAKAKWLGVIEQ